MVRGDISTVTDFAVTHGHCQITVIDNDPEIES